MQLKLRDHLLLRHYHLYNSFSLSVPSTIVLTKAFRLGDRNQIETSYWLKKKNKHKKAEWSFRWHSSSDVMRCAIRCGRCHIIRGQVVTKFSTQRCQKISTGLSSLHTHARTHARATIQSDWPMTAVFATSAATVSPFTRAVTQGYECQVSIYERFEPGRLSAIFNLNLIGTEKLHCTLYRAQERLECF